MQGRSWQIRGRPRFSPSILRERTLGCRHNAIGSRLLPTENRRRTKSQKHRRCRSGSAQHFVRRDTHAGRQSGWHGPDHWRRRYRLSNCRHRRRPGFPGPGSWQTNHGTPADWLHNNAPDSAYVSLIADGPAHMLYSQFGFEPTAPASIGMAMLIERNKP